MYTMKYKVKLVKISPTAHRDLRILAARTGKTMKDVVDILVARGLRDSQTMGVNIETDTQTGCGSLWLNFDQEEANTR